MSTRANNSLIAAAIPVFSNRIVVPILQNCSNDFLNCIIELTTLVGSGELELTSAQQQKILKHRHVLSAIKSKKTRKGVKRDLLASNPQAAKLVIEAAAPTYFASNPSATSDTTTSVAPKAVDTTTDKKTVKPPRVVDPVVIASPSVTPTSPSETEQEEEEEEENSDESPSTPSPQRTLPTAPPTRKDTVSAGRSILDQLLRDCDLLTEGDISALTDSSASDLE